MLVIADHIWQPAHTIVGLLTLRADVEVLLPLVVKSLCDLDLKFLHIFLILLLNFLALLYNFNHHERHLALSDVLKRCFLRAHFTSTALLCLQYFLFYTLFAKCMLAWKNCMRSAVSLVVLMVAAVTTVFKDDA